ncbi:MAG: phosphatidylserine/phosphatidylglycerophosphate/cardiolipin synthase family protein [Cyanobacteria bacterium P01_G01_bin.19]
MYRLTWIFFLCLAITGCEKSSSTKSYLPQDKYIQAYFNHRETGKQTYTDPYRQIERGGDNLEAIIIEAIATAKLTIDLAVQEINLPLIAQALTKAHDSGVKVRVILDNNYSRPLSSFNPQEVERLQQYDRAKYDEFLALADLDSNGRLDAKEISTRDALIILQNAGIPVINDTADGSKGSGLMHHKFMVIDGKTIITGSTNFTLSGIHGDFHNLETRGNVNHLLRIENPAVANLFTQEFDYMWGNNQAGGNNSKFGLSKPRRSPQSISWNNSKITVHFAPFSRAESWHSSTNGLISRTIDNAKNSINLALFVFSEQLISDRLQQKQKEGIIIKGVFDRGFAFRYYSEVLDLLGTAVYRNCQPESENNPWTQPLDTAGVADIPRGDKLHHKFASIDGHTVITGSQNWSQAANHINDESLLIIENPILTQHFNREFQRLFKAAIPGIPAKIATEVKQQQQKCLDILN